MKSFATGLKYSFEIDGKPFSLPALTFDDVSDVVQVMSVDPAEQHAALRAFIAAKTDKRTITAIGGLPIAAVGELFQDWTGVQGGGVTPGELEGSPGR